MGIVLGKMSFDFLGLSALGLLCMASLALLEAKYTEFDQPIITLGVSFIIYLRSDLASF